ncbi:MAG: hypothetical protein UU93_C0011G0015 [Candidatus Amesbacteria bacterium GW2011_GWA2_42_12]|uniref:DUF3800 domain-containing protein n=1 Tax=Candidatus Amesbacteria bacterium GW2011_GWA2_42_12 TaxID=1618356 RepID=A0A0G0Y5N4_9BACT|nr:MAG: hypothetical protein UU93_C0011G0015 [Candidatus Amesbacteria bacterium GW2011_GWA2_42_12]
MLVFVDDSGDPGFKIDKGSSLVFVIACVVFDDELEAEKTAVVIKELRRKLKFPDSVEFKFNNSRKEVKELFLNTVNTYKFKIRCLVVKKNLIHSKKLQSSKNSFYSYAVKLLLEHSGGSIIDAKIRIDGSGDRVFRKSFTTYLRKELNSKQEKIMRDCKLVDSKSNVLIQLADMIAGSIRRSYDEGKSDRNLYKKIILKHIEDEWQFE